MRPTIALVLLLGCAADPAPAAAPDAAADVPALDAPVQDIAVQDRPAADAAAVDAVDASAPDVIDAAAPDVVDVPAMDVDPRQTPECRAVNQTCDGRRVNVQTGERDGGTTYHCGRCGNACAPGFGCLTCVCIPL